jgi:hypothetical protein
MHATLPVNHEANRACDAVDIDDALMDKRAQASIGVVVLAEFLKSLGKR